MLRLVMKKITLILLFIAIITSCQVPIGGNAIQVSGKNFTVASTGGDVDITTDGAAECTLTEPDKQTSDFVRLHLFDDYITLNVPPRAFSNVPLQIWSL